jgi:Tol biopolymer transport system component
MVALREYSEGGYDIFLKRLDAGNRTRLTFDAAHEKMPVWEPGGVNVTYLSNRNGNFDVWSKAANGAGPAELLLDLDVDIYNIDWSPDGEWLLLWTAEDDILGYRPGQDSEPIPLLAEAYDELDPTVSPDGRWIAYVANQTGANQVYVRPFPNVSDGLWQVSNQTARYPRWAHNGRELFFQDDPAQPSMRMVEYEATDVFRFEAPVLLFDSPGWSGSQPFGEPFDVEPGDERFIIAVNAGSVGGDAESGPRFVLVNNFMEELKRLVP